MPARFFLHDPPTAGMVRIRGELASHLARSLRLRSGDDIVAVCEGREHGVRLTRTGVEVEGVVTWSRPATGEPSLQVTLVQALPRERMEDCVDIAVQAGVAAIVPVHTERSVARPEPGRVASRLRRWNAVARESAQLAGRGTIPPVHMPVGLGEALAALPAGTQLIVCTSALDADPSPPPLGRVGYDAHRMVALLVGPEGGLGPADLAAARQHGAVHAHLGPRILRSRYAGALALTLLLSRSGDLDAAMVGAPT
ncbi:MAG: RsmE family RNA methyltransferase [Candidatus Dormibacteria bacterium]